MKKKYQILGFLFLLICSVIYDLEKPTAVHKEKKQLSYVVLEGEFLKQGKYEFEGSLTVKELIDDVGISSKANLKALSLHYQIQDESSLYLPRKNDLCISLNNATKEELMQLERVGEKTAEKIIDYRKDNRFECIEDLMNVSGIGEKTFLRLRDYLCL